MRNQEDAKDLTEAIFRPTGDSKVPNWFVKQLASKNFHQATVSKLSNNNVADRPSPVSGKVAKTPRQAESDKHEAQVSAYRRHGVAPVRLRHNRLRFVLMVDNPGEGTARVVSVVRETTGPWWSARTEGHAAFAQPAGLWLFLSSAVSSARCAAAMA